jgi:hypothetical protein
VAQTAYVAELQNIATRGLHERMVFENLLEGYKKEIELLHQPRMERERYHQEYQANLVYEVEEAQVERNELKYQLEITLLPYKTEIFTRLTAAQSSEQGSISQLVLQYVVKSEIDPQLTFVSDEA